jgi:enoyl-CoA hydratase
VAEPVSYERVGAAALVSIDRPERRNAVDGPTAQALGQAYRRFADDDGARVLVLTGAGDAAFCAGADLKALETFGPRLGDPDGPLGFTRVTARKPTIAAISGWCLAGGLELALWCDLRIAVEGSTLGFPERRWGVPLIDGGTQRLPRIVGLGRALDIILTGRMVAADEALSMGLLTEIDVETGTEIIQVKGGDYSDAKKLADQDMRQLHATHIYNTQMRFAPDGSKLPPKTIVFVFTNPPVDPRLIAWLRSRDVVPRVGKR